MGLNPCCLVSLYKEEIWAQTQRGSEAGTEPTQQTKEREIMQAAPGSWKSREAFYPESQRERGCLASGTGDNQGLIPNHLVCGTWLWQP